MDLEVYAQVKRSIKTLLDLSLDGYKDEQMRRRLDTWLTRAGDASWPAYFRRVRADPQELARFRNYLTINVSSFFRDPERWEELNQIYLPALFKARSPLRVWSAGCSIGLEPYSLVMALDEVRAGRLNYLVATDLDRGALDKARARGPFSANDIQNVSPTRLARYFETGGPPYFIVPRFAQRVQFREQNLLTDPYEGDFDLIVCRNVVIYFTGPAKDTLYRKMAGALRVGGLLFVGGTEIIPSAHDLGLKSIGVSFYQKISA